MYLSTGQNCVSQPGQRMAVVLLLGLLAAFLTPNTATAFLYKAPEGSLKDNCVVWHEGVFRLFTMYRFEEKGSDLEDWRSVWSATSTDGVHWTDVGPVIKDAPFGIYAMRVWKVGDRFLLNHGSFTGTNQDVLKLWESRDLVHWEYLGPEYDIRRPDGQRIDHMDVISEEEGGRTVYYGYAVGGVLRSEDGVRWTWLGELPLTGDLDIRVVQEPGGCQRIGDRYYLLVGGFFPGGFQYAVGTYTAENPAGPFHPDYPALRLNGYTGRNLVALWACFCRKPDELLLSNYILDPVGRFWWHAPLKSAVVDDAGHLRTGYWKGNEALKGAEIPCDLSAIQPVLPATGGNSAVAENVLSVEAHPLPHVRWITSGRPNIALAFLDRPFGNEKGFVFECSLRITPVNDITFPAIGLAIEKDDQTATAVLFETWDRTEIGTLRWAEEAHFESEDQTGPGCATVAGIPVGETCRFRLLFRQNIFEMYLNDLLVQTYSAERITGRIGFVAQDGVAAFSDVKAWEMSLP